MANGYKAALRRFEQAVIAHYDMGARHPGDRADIQKDYDEAKAELIKKLQYRKLAAEEQAKELAHGSNCGCHYCT